MKLIVFSALLLLGAVSGGPISSREDDDLVVTKDFFIEELKIYEGQNDIVKIYVPINKLNFDDDAESNEDEDDGNDATIFIVEAEEKEGQRVDHGLYVRKNKKVKKLLDNGRDITAPHDDSTVAYFAAKDGIYIYNAEKNEAEKYGSINEELVGIVSGTTNGTFNLYVLTPNKEVFKVTDEGTKKVKVDDVKDAEQIVMDFTNNLYYTDSKDVYVVNKNGVKKIEGLPQNAKLTLIRPPFLFEDGGIPLVADKASYIAYPNGTSEEADIEVDAPITAYSMEASLVQYYAYNKKVYEYNILAILLGSLLEELKKFLDDKQEDIQKISTRSRADFVKNTV